jgi:hypothetical protein
MKNIILFLSALILAACNQDELKSVSTDYECLGKLQKYTLHVENEKLNEIENYDIFLTDINDSSLPCGTWMYEEASLEVYSAETWLYLAFPYTDNSWQLEITSKSKDKLIGDFYQETWGALIPSGKFTISK